MTNPHEAPMPEDLHKLYERVKASHPSMGWRWAIPLFKRLAAAEKRAADAEAQVKALSRPVSDEEAQKYAVYMDCEGWCHRFRFTAEQVTALIAVRLSSAKGETKP